MRSVLALLLFPVWVLAAPPEVKFPQAEVKVPLHSFVVLKAEVKDGKGVTKYRMPSVGLSYLPKELLNDPSAIVFIPLAKGTYTFEAWSGNEDGASDIATTKVVVGDGVAEPPPLKPDDPKDPPPAGGKFFLMVVRADGPVDAKTAAAVRLPAWDEVRKDGHEMKDYTRTEVSKVLRQSIEEDAAKYKARLDSYVGKVVVLRVSADGRSSSFVGEKPLPATDADVKNLIK